MELNPLTGIGVILLPVGAAFAFWARPLNDRFERFDDRYEWARRYKAKRIDRLRRWESNPTKYWFIPVLIGSLILLASPALLFTEGTGIAGPLIASAISGGLIAYGFVRKEGTNLSEESNRQRTVVWIMRSSGVLMMSMGVITLLLGCDVLD